MGPWGSRGMKAMVNSGTMDTIIRGPMKFWASLIVLHRLPMARKIEA